MSDRRRQEIEEKKAKLAELRRARDERKALLAQAEKGPSAAEVSHPSIRTGVGCHEADDA